MCTCEGQILLGWQAANATALGKVGEYKAGDDYFNRRHSNSRPADAALPPMETPRYPTTDIDAAWSPAVELSRVA